MKKNMGSADRIIRLLMAALAVFLYFTGAISGAFGIAVIVVAVIFTLTSVVGVCPMYSLLGVSTCPASKA